MTTHRTLATVLGLTTAALGTGLASAAPASAGGIIVFASPSFDNSCTNTGTAAQSAGDTTHSSGTANGPLAAIPAETPLNHCGGADLPSAQSLLRLDRLSNSEAQPIRRTTRRIQNRGYSPANYNNDIALNRI